MDLKKLLYFVAIVEEGQITRAAQRLHMAQPPLSLQLKALEEELQVQLLERNHTNVEPTQAGWTLYYRAKEVLNAVEGMVTEVTELGRGVRGTLSIGTVMSCVSYLPAPIKQFQHQYPDVVFNLWEGDSPRIEELLSAREIELGITRLPVSSQHFNIAPLTVEPLVAVEPPSWGVLKHDSISVVTLANYPLMALHGQGSHGLFEHFVELCQRHGFSPHITCESPDVAALLTLVDAQVGIAIVPKSAIHLRPQGTLSFAEITPSIPSETALIWLKNRKLSKAAEHFKQVLVDSFGD